MTLPPNAIPRAALATLRYLIIMQDGIKVQVGNFSKTNKHAGWNKSAGRKIFKI